MVVKVSTGATIILLAITVAVAAVAGAMYKLWTMQDAGTASGNRVWAMFKQLKEVCLAVYETIKEKLIAAWDSAMISLDRIAYKLGGVRGGFLEWVTDVLPKVVDWIGNKLVGTFTMLLKGVEAVIFIVEAFTDLWNGDFRRVQIAVEAVA